MLHLPQKDSAARRYRRNDGVDRTGDARLWKLHDEFCRAREKLQKLDTPLARSEKPGAARRAHEKWKAQLSVTDKVARKIANSRATTIDGMLMKIQVAGSIFDWVGNSYQFRPYISHDPESLWQINSSWSVSEEELLIASLRNDLLRLRERM